MTFTKGLQTAISHMAARVPREHLRPGYERIVCECASFHWELPRGGSINVSFSFDIKGHELVPACRISASIGQHIEDAEQWARTVSTVTASALETLALMRASTYTI